ncbi:sulfotransferase, putative [Ixodes scapularis]|uniref:Sulfotransferase, putative n=1 Tax=Ixodes scapularis TaxID=6945 RepID=B7P6W8_IXOSC|nr:sulfotransferase, putative [Ixodes scapularis]|eukprot:XP_002409344.1 sulfotransferase, putative [Ixodes scapularis]
MSSEVYRDVEGPYIPVKFEEKTVRSVLSYEPQEGDIFIVSYPKCGTTWVQYITYNIFNDGVRPPSMLDVLRSVPFLECRGIPDKDLPRPVAMKTHLPFSEQPYSEGAKYIYVSRNPYDCCVSFYNYVKTRLQHQFEDGTFDEFFESFVRGKVLFGDYFDHLLSWYAHGSDPNVLFMTYEGLKKDTESCVLKVADFIGKEYGRKLRDHPELLERIVSNVSLEAMKGLEKEMKTKAAERSVTEPSEMPEGVRSKTALFGGPVAKPFLGDLVRKGVVGDWKNHFSPVQVERMKEWIALKTKGSDVMCLWKDIDLP